MRRAGQFLCLGLFLLSGCGKFFIPQNSTGSGSGNGSGNTAAGDVLFVMNGTAGTISGYTVSTSGVLTAVANSPYSPGVVPTSMAVTPGNTFLYYGTATGILGYSIGTNGALSALNSSAPLATDVISPLSMQVDSSGSYLLTAGEDLSTTLPQLAIFSIDSTTGALTLVGSTFDLKQSGNGSTSGTVPNLPIQLYIAPNNSFVFLTLGSGGTEILTLDTATPSFGDTGYFLNLLSSGTAQTGVIANATSTTLYVTETGTGVRAFPLLTTGLTGTELTGSPFPTSTGPAALAFDSTGDYLYVSSKALTTAGGGSIEGFSVAASGALTALSPSSYATGSVPVSLTLDQSKKFMAVANDGGNPAVGIYSFDATTLGKLDPVTNSGVSNAAGSTLIVSTH